MPKEVSYEQDVNHFDGITVRRVAASQVLGPGALVLARDILRVKQEAWGSADWFVDAMGGEEKAKEKAQKIFGGTAKQWMRLARSVVAPGGNTYYVAEAWDMEYGADGVGIGRFKYDVSGNALARAAKHTVRRDKIYACIGDIDVRPILQRTEIGTAILDTGLRGFSPEKKSTVYIASNNEKLIGSMGDLGYIATGAHARPDLFGLGSDIEEVRLEAPSVRNVQGALHEMNPWLKHGLVTN